MRTMKNPPNNIGVEKIDYKNIILELLTIRIVSDYEWRKKATANPDLDFAEFAAKKLLCVFGSIDEPFIA